MDNEVTLISWLVLFLFLLFSILLFVFSFERQEIVPADCLRVGTFILDTAAAFLEGISIDMAGNETNMRGRVGVYAWTRQDKHTYTPARRRRPSTRGPTGVLQNLLHRSSFPSPPKQIMLSSISMLTRPIKCLARRSAHASRARFGRSCSASSLRIGKSSFVLSTCASLSLPSFLSSNSWGDFI